MTPRQIKTKFELIGTVLKMTPSVILLQRQNSKQQHWIDINGRKTLPKEGDEIKATITISSYISKDGQFRHKIRLIDYLPMEHEDFINVERTFRPIDNYLVDIIDIIPTALENEYIIKSKNITTNEIAYTRHRSRTKPEIGRCILFLELKSMSTLIGTDGLPYENRYISEYTDKEGKKIAKEKFTWYATLCTDKIYTLDTHGEGDSTESI